MRLLLGVATILFGLNLIWPSAAPEAAGREAAPIVVAQSGADLMGARGRLNFARESVNRGDMEGAERKLREAEKYLEGGTAEETAPVRAEIAALRQEIAKAVTAANEKTLKRAGEQVERAKAALADQRQSEAEAALRYAEQIVRDVPDVGKAELMAEIKALRAQIAGGAAPTQAQPAQAAQPAPAASTADLASARSRVMFARESLQRGQTGDVERKLQDAEKYLEGGTADETAAIRQEIAEIRRQLAEAEAKTGQAGSGQAKPAQPQPQPATTQAAPAAPPAASTADLGTARSRIMFARESLKRGQIDEAERKLQEAERALGGGVAEETAPLRQEIAAVRAEIAAASGATDAEANARAIARARAVLEEARTYLANDDLGQLELSLTRATKLVDNVPEAEKADVLAEIAAIRQSVPSPAAREAEALARSLTIKLNFAEDQIRSAPHMAENAFSEVEDALQPSETRQAMDPETLRGIKTRLAELRDRLFGGRKAEALHRAAGPLGQLEQALADDPYKNLDTRSADSTRYDLAVLSDRAHNALKGQPADDADFAAMLVRLEAANARLKQFDEALDKRRMLARLAESWQVTKDRFVGWEQEEQQETGTIGLRPWVMHNTALALLQTRDWLADSLNVEQIERYKDDAEFAALLDEVKLARDGAATKLNAAFNQSLDEAEKLPAPVDEFTFNQPDSFAAEASSVFAGTPYAEPNAQRASKLGERWRAEVAAILERAAADLKRMTDEADAAWPKIDAKISARDDFHPDRAAEFQGKTIRLRGVYDRARWDFGGPFEFAIWIDEKAIAGEYAPHVAAEIRKVVESIRSYDGGRTPTIIDDHIRWDVIGVVDGGKCRIRKRVITTIIDAKTRDVIGKEETYVPIDCIKITVTGLHAGPVAVGP